ncbi:MAG: IS256 family transposase [Myxococcota bacterium]
MSKVIKIDDARIREHLGEMVRGTVEETLNAMLDAEADELTGATRYERTEERRDYRSGHYKRKLLTGAGEVELKVPKLRKLPFETSIIERYKRREASVEESLIEMYLAGVSVRRVEDITEALWGTRVSSVTVSKLNKQIYEKIEAWRTRPIERSHPYVYLDGIVLKRSWGGEVHNVSVLVAIGVAEDGFREILDVAEGAKEDHEWWTNFLRYLKRRGLRGSQLFITDKCLGLVEALAEHFPDARWQRCMVHFYRNVFTQVLRGPKVREVAAMLKAVHASEDLASAREKAASVVAKLRAMKLAKAAECVETGIEETFSYYHFPSEHWRRIRTNNPLERLLREVRRRTRVVGNFPDGESALMLVAARLRHVSGTKWGTRKYLDVEHHSETVAN